jgi:hypothetical protein
MKETWLWCKNSRIAEPASVSENSQIKTKAQIKNAIYSADQAQVKEYQAVKGSVDYLLYSSRRETCIMKTLMKRMVGFVRKEWFLLVMIIAISVIVFLFEVF